MIVGVVLLLVLAATGLYFAFGRGSDYSVGSCVKQGENNTVLEASCDDPGAFKIVNKVDKEEDCKAPDATVSLEQGGEPVEVLCLKKVG